MQTVLFLSNPDVNFPVSEYTNNIASHLNQEDGIICYHNRYNDQAPHPSWLDANTKKDTEAT